MMSAQLVTQIRPEIRAVLGRLRRRIRRYVLLEGTALVLVVLALLFWASLGIDWAYFQLRTLELPIWFRKTFTVAALCLFVFSFSTWVIFRISRSVRMKALALLLERRFPELDDRLITAVELEESTSGKETPLTAAMLNRTVDDVTEAARSLEIEAVFDKAPLRRAITVAAVLIASIGGFAWANEQAVQRWARAYIHWDDEYWTRNTTLLAKVVAQPGDRIKQFKDFEYRHPRGGDLTLLIEVPKHKPDGSPWKVPQRVVLYYKLDQGRGSGRVTCTQVADRQLLRQENAAAIFRYSVGGLLDGLEFWVKGGDFTNRLPYKIVVVDPPRIDQITLECDYPDYTGLNGQFAQQHKKVQGTQISLPMETRFLMHAAVNKELVSVRVQFGRYELAFGYGLSQTDAEATRTDQPRATLTQSSEEGIAEETVALPDDVVERFFASDRRSFTLPFALSTGESEADRRRTAEDMDDFGKPFVIPPDSLMRIYLEDIDDITSSDPARLTLTGIIDNPPVIETELRGISASITRKATVPVAGLISDDYGIQKARFDFRIDDAQEWRARPFRIPPDENDKDFKLRRSAEQPFEQFEVLPLDLTLGQKLTLTVFAQDADNLNGPNVSRGERYVFQIVSTEEILAILYGKELNLRRRFEQIISEVEGAQKDLITHKSRVQEAAQLRDKTPEPGGKQEHDEKIREIDMAVAACAERSLHQIRKNASETRAIEESFKEILEELVNNAVHTRQMVERIDDLIVKPLGRINEVDFERVDKSIGRFRLANEKGNNPTPQIDESLEDIGTMLEHMRKVLAEIRDLAEFHEALKDLKLIIDQQERLTEETENRRKKSIIDKLKETLPDHDDK